jgi:hypothetical protein
MAISVEQTKRRLLIVSLITAIAVGSIVTALVVTTARETQNTLSILLLFSTLIFDMIVKSYETKINGCKTVSFKLRKVFSKKGIGALLISLLYVVPIIVFGLLGEMKIIFILVGVELISIKLVDAIILLKD